MFYKPMSHDARLEINVFKHWVKGIILSEKKKTKLLVESDFFRLAFV